MEIVSYVKKINLWIIISTLCLIFIISPFILLSINLFLPNNENWNTILTYWIKDYINNTLTILFFTGLLTCVIGTLLAFIFCYYSFPYKKIFEIFLILPIAIPAYIMAYIYSDLFSYTGGIQLFFREILHLNINPKYFDIISIQGVIFIFVISLYPYVYLMVKSFLKNQSASIVESSRILGRNMSSSLFKTIIPISLPVIFGSVILVLMEVLSDYGVTSYFGIHTFATGIFQAWFGMHDVVTAIKISSFAVLLSSILVVTGRVFGKTKKLQISDRSRVISDIELRGIHLLLAYMFISIIIVLSFITPVTQLVIWSIKTYKVTITSEFWKYLFSSISVSVIVTILVSILALVLCNTMRLYSNKKMKILTTVCGMGYATPSAVLALGVLTLFVFSDSILYKLNIISTKLSISSSIIMLIFAYTVKFLAVGIQNIESGFSKIGNTYSEASRTLGLNITKTFFKVDIYMLKNSIISTLMLVFIDVVKELPITLLLRPYNFTTLATKTYMYAVDEQLQKSALPSLIIILLASIFVLTTRKLSEN